MGRHARRDQPGAYDDGRSHLATATHSPSTGMVLDVDGALGTNLSATVAENFSGCWRVGYADLNAWPSPPTGYCFAGSVAHAAVFDRVLAADEVGGRYTA